MPEPMDVGGKSPFLLKDMLVEHAQEVGSGELALIDASRGAANWQQAQVLAAWHVLGMYASHAAAESGAVGPVGGPIDPGAKHHEAFADFVGELAGRRASRARKPIGELAGRAASRAGKPDLRDDSEEELLRAGCALLERSWEYLAEHVLTDRSLDRVVYELAEAAAGRVYPTPPTLSFVQPIVTRYLAPLLFGGNLELAGQFRVLMCEGATTAIAQVAATLARNRLIRPGDAVAMWWPTYEPLRDLVERQLGCRVVPVRRDPERGWAAAPGELDRLRDPAVRLVIAVSPGNPVPVVTDAAGLDALEKAVAERPELLVLSDYVYMHFLDKPVETEIGRLPHNTIGVYSFSKDFGLAGARLGALLIHPDCAAERALRELGEPECSEADGYYRARSLEPRELALADRMVADSRGVSFVHMSGLSTPLQALACLCACYDLVESDSGEYFAWIRGELRARLEALYQGLGLPLPAWADSPSSRYATIIDLCRVAAERGGEELAEALRGRDLWSFMRHLAHRWQVVLTPGEAFGAGEWSVRACFPSIDAGQARELGRRVAEAAGEFARGVPCDLCEAQQ